MIRSAKPNQWLKFSKMDIHRIIATIFVVVLIIGMSTGVLIMMYQHTEADCWASLEDNAESAGRKISLMMKDNHTFLDNLGHLLAAHIDLKSNAVVQHVQESSMGTLQAPVRMYLPDGARVTETEGLVEGTINYADLVKGYFPAGYQAEDTEVFLDYQATL